MRQPYGRLYAPCKLCSARSKHNERVCKEQRFSFTTLSTPGLLPVSFCYADRNFWLKVYGLPTNRFGLGQAVYRTEYVSPYSSCYTYLWGRLFMLETYRSKAKLRPYYSQNGTIFWQLCSSFGNTLSVRKQLNVFNRFYTWKCCNGLWTYRTKATFVLTVTTLTSITVSMLFNVEVIFRFVANGHPE